MTKRFAIIFAFGLVFLALILGFVVIPLSQSILRLSREFFVQRRELKTAAADRTTVEAFESFSKEFQRDLAKSAAMLVDPETPIEFVRFLEQSAEGANLSLAVNLGAVRKQKNDQWFSLDFQVSGQGAYPAVFVFLKQLEYAPFAMEIQNIAINKIGSSVGAPAKTAGEDVKFSFGIKAYVKPPKTRQ
ncbi:MAG: hypothetical protein HYV78_01185 [Candidatus Wildermuthbacteria bacterium]|nr:hypothetical protein [Candidatus Wildermuthbacteria bacterium]